MGNKIITLSGAATDVLYALFFRGALQSGDLPAKSGAAELRDLGFAETRHTATEYQKENYFTFLTAEGQEFAIKHLVDTRFGKPVDKQYCSAITIGVELDTSDAQKALDELGDKIRNSDAFKALNDIYQLPHMKICADQQVKNAVADALDEVCRRYFDVFGYPETGTTKVVVLAGRWVAIEGIYTIEEMRDAVEYIKRLRKQKADEKAMAESSPYFVKDGQVFIKDAFIGNDLKSEISTNYKINLGISGYDPVKGTIFTTDKFGIHSGIDDNVDYLIKNAKASQDAMQNLEAKISQQASVIAGFKDDIAKAVRDEIAKQIKPGGAIWNASRRGF